MSTVPEIESAVQRLSSAELREFRAWFLNFDAAKWDRQIERDAAAGRLVTLADEALAEHRAGRTRPL